MTPPWPPPWPVGSEEAERLARAVADEERGAPDVLAPTPGAQARVWAALEARAGRRRRPWRIALAAASLAVALGAVGVRIAVRDRPARYAGEAQRVLDLHGAARVVRSRDVEATLAQDDRAGIRFDLARGSLLAAVEHREAQAPFVVTTPRASVRVVGTVLWVDVTSGGATTVVVGRGAVEVSSEGGESVTVRAGERWPATSTASPAADDLAALGDAADGTRFAPPAAAAPPPALPPASSSPAATLAPDSPTTPGLAPTPGPVDPCAALTRVAAIACLEHVAANADPLRAETALYEVGWRQLRERGDTRAALAAWERQRRRFPSGTLRSEADVSIIDALVKLGERKHARREIDAWLATHPDGVSAPGVHFLRASILRAAGDCALALADYDAALRAPHPRWSAQARAERADCLAASPPRR